MERTLDEIQERLIQLYDYVNSDDFPTPVAVSEEVQREGFDSDNSSEYDEILTVLSDEYDGISELLEQRHNVKATPQRVFEICTTSLIRVAAA